MKLNTFFFSLFLATGIVNAQQEPEATKPAATASAMGVNPGTPEAKAAEEEFLKRPAEEQKKFQQLLVDGEKLLAEKRVPEALQKLIDAESIAPIHPVVLNLKGSCLVQIRDFDRALLYFEKAAKLYPTFWQSHFNRAEMFFVQKKWEEAEKQFRELLKQGDAIDATTRKLMEYKVMLCLIKQQKFDDATPLINRYDIYDDAPIYYYSMAALHFEKKENKEAEEWVTNARAIYDAQLYSIYEDSLTEIGWLFVF
ncbi:MAG: tetratricopeptide repeat protein [Verrucomicrobiales bacterium]